MKRTFTLLLLYFIAMTVRAQDSGFDNSPPADESQLVYVIRNMDFDIKGRSRPFALIYHGDFKEGERIQGKANLDRYMTRKTRMLMNQRVLEEVSMEYTLGEAEEDGALPVNILIHVKDTWNIIGLPYPQYDSNDGFKFTLKLRDYNFLGTMSPLRLDFSYQNDTDHRNSFGIMLDSDTPFRAAGLTWNLNFDHELGYTFGEPLFYQNTTGLSVELPVESTIATIGFNEYIIVNESNSEHDIDKYQLEDDYFNGAYAATELFSAFKIPLPLEVWDYGTLSYTPRLAGKIAYRKGGVDEPRRPLITLSQTLGFGRVNWIDNFRQGLEASVENGNNFYTAPYDWYIDINANAAYYHYFNKFFGFSTRLQYRQRINDIFYNAAEPLRGIMNNQIRAEYMLSLNMDFPFRILRFYPSELFNKPKLHFFDFELHLSPFFDFALAEGYYKKVGSDLYEDNNFSFSDGFYSGGAELIIFPAFMRSLYLRFSLGYNIKKIVEDHRVPKWDEIFIGMGHHY